MDLPSWFALMSGIAALLSAFWAGVQGRAAKRQASAAEHQTDLNKKQLEEMRRANEIAESHRMDERESLKLSLDISAKPVKDGARWWIVVVIENNCQKNANIQKISLVFEDGSRISAGRWSGEIELRDGWRFGVKTLPGILPPGQACEFRFCEWNRTGSDLSGYEPPNYTDPCWQSVERVEVQASNQYFYTEDGFWETYFSCADAPWHTARAK